MCHCSYRVGGVVNVENISKRLYGNCMVANACNFAGPSRKACERSALVFAFVFLFVFAFVLVCLAADLLAVEIFGG